jgi:predicted DNA-binding transcriptional regulator YafY
MYHPTSRVLAVLELLQSHRRMTGAELAQRLEVNARTLRRYITMLQDLGIPIIAERGRYGAYTLGAGFRLPPMMFSNDEALALELGLLAAEQLGLTEQGFAIESARAKLEYVMPLELKTRSRALSQSIQLGLEAYAAPASTQMMLLMSSATQQHQRVYLRYQSDKEEASGRDFDSYGIAFRRGRWYAVGWCHLRQAIRSFRMDRILEAQPREIRFTPPDNFDALQYVQQSIALLPRPFSFEVLLKTDMLTAQRHIFDILGVLEPREDGVLMRGSAEELSWLAQVLSGLPFAFLIHEPAELRQALRDHAAELLRLADL